MKYRNKKKHTLYQSMYSERKKKLFNSDLFSFEFIRLFQLNSFKLFAFEKFKPQFIIGTK